jgi:phage shock protein C
MNEVRRLFRSRSDRVIGGVCGGLAAYLNVDPMLIRLAAVALVFLNGVGVVAYLVMWIVVPDEEAQSLSREANLRANLNDIGAQTRRMGESLRASLSNGERSTVIGVILVLLGIVFLADQFFVDLIHSGLFWAILLIVVGVVVLVTYTRRR